MDLMTLVINLNVVIGLAYFLVAFLIMVAPFTVKTLRVLGMWGVVLGFHAILFFTGCGTHHFEFSGHVTLGSIEVEQAGIHFLITSLMQVYGALAVSGILIFKGNRLMDKLKTELASTQKKENI